MLHEQHQNLLGKRFAISGIKWMDLPLNLAKRMHAGIPRLWLLVLLERRKWHVRSVVNRSRSSTSRLLDMKRLPHQAYPARAMERARFKQHSGYRRSSALRWFPAYGDFGNEMHGSACLRFLGRVLDSSSMCRPTRLGTAVVHCDQTVFLSDHELHLSEEVSDLGS